MEEIVCTCQAAASADTVDITALQGVWVPAIVAIVSLAVNIVFTIFVAPTISEKHNQKVAMYKICTDFFDYLTDLVSFTCFDGAPSMVRKFSLKIHFMFTLGEAPESIANNLEAIYQKVKTRKTLQCSSEIEKWEKEYRDLVHKLRVDLAKYVGVFK